MSDISDGANETQYNDINKTTHGLAVTETFLKYLTKYATVKICQYKRKSKYYRVSNSFQ